MCFSKHVFAVLIIDCIRLMYNILKFAHIFAQMYNKNEAIEKGSNTHAFTTRWSPDTTAACPLAEFSEVAVADQSGGVLRTRSARWRARRPWPRTARVAGSGYNTYLMTYLVMRNTVYVSLESRMDTRCCVTQVLALHKLMHAENTSVTFKYPLFGCGGMFCFSTVLLLI